VYLEVEIIVNKFYTIFMWVVSECSPPKLVFSCEIWSSQVAASFSLILVIPPHQVVWYILVSPSISSYFIISSIYPFPFHFIINMFLVLSLWITFGPFFVLILFVQFPAPYLSSYSPINCVFLLPFVKWTFTST